MHLNGILFIMNVLISNMEKISLYVGVLGWNFFGLVTNCIYFLEYIEISYIKLYIDKECSLMFKNGCKKAILSPIFDKTVSYTHLTLPTICSV